MDDPHNQKFVEKFFKVDPNGLVAQLISEVVQLPLDFDQSLLNTLAKGDLVNLPILNSFLHPSLATFRPAYSPNLYAP